MASPKLQPRFPAMGRSFLCIRVLAALLFLCLACTPSLAANLDAENIWNPLSRRLDADRLTFQVRTLPETVVSSRADKESLLPILQSFDNPEAEWRSEDSGGINLGFTDHAVQIRFGIINDTSERQALTLQIAYPALDFVNMHTLLKGRLSSVYSGDMRPFSQRQITHPEFILPLILDPGDSVQLLLEVQTQGSLQVPLKLWSSDRFLSATTTLQKLHFFYFGVLSVTILLTLTLFFMLKELTYLYYAMATAGYLSFFAGIRGFSLQHLLGNQPELNMRLFLVSMPVLALFSLLFAQRFLNSAKVMPRLNRLIQLMIALESFNLLLAMTADYNVAIRFSALLAAPLWLALIVAGPLAWRTGSRPAIYFTTAWTLLTLGIIVTLLHKAGLLPTTWVTEYSMQVGSAFEAVLLTFGLADRLYQEREEKIRMQDQLLQESTQRRDMQQKLIEYALHDLLTGLPNRSLLEMCMRELLADPKDEWFVAVLWFRNMRNISITLGEKNTEEILRLTAADLNNWAIALPGIQTIEVFHGKALAVSFLAADRLVMVAQGQTCRAHREEYKNMLDRLIQPINYEGFKLELEPVLGVSTSTGAQRDAATLLRQAQIAVEQASQHNRSYAFYREAVDEYNPTRLTLMTDLRHALVNNETVLFYQPKLDARTHAVVGLEALMRWQHPSLGWIPPDQFIPVAETTDLIHQLSFWVMQSALRDLQVFRQKGYPIKVAINLSAKNLSARNLEDVLESARKTEGLLASDITLELTETAIMREPEAGILQLKQFRELGYGIAIDDFGSGYCSLSYLKQMPVQEIKIDKSLVSEINTSDGAQLIMRATINMCHQLGFTVVAEGVETGTEAALLESMGCDTLQGYHFARPMSREHMLTWLAEYRPAGALTPSPPST